MNFKLIKYLIFAFFSFIITGLNGQSQIYEKQTKPFAINTNLFSLVSYQSEKSIHIGLSKSNIILGLIGIELDYYSNRKSFGNWLEENIEDTLAIFNLPPEHRRRLRTTNGVERMHEEVKRRTIPVRIFPNRDSALRLIGSIWQDIHEKWITGKRYLNMDALQEWKEEQEMNEVETTSIEC